MFRKVECGKEKKRDPFDKSDFLKENIWERKDTLSVKLKKRETKDHHDNFFSTVPHRVALEGEIYFSSADNKIYRGNKDGTWTQSSVLDEVIVLNREEAKSNAQSAFVTSVIFTGIGVGLDEYIGGVKGSARLKGFEITSFHPQGSYEFNKIADAITHESIIDKVKSTFTMEKDFKFDKIGNGTVGAISDGKIYVKGTAESVSALKSVARVAKGLGVSAGLIGIYLSYKEYEAKKISGEILALDIAMTILSFTGPGAFVAGVYFILIRTDTKDKYFSPKPENIYESAKVKIDKTQVYKQGVKFVSK
ncbi:hypothetical protein [Flavobacterium chilense]|uniref:Uncharacterized protein n=1 Tax=Flavobacterium chilense TaxID=946677 RepID=A0A1M6Z5V4_9FLAO|nr:hypothetical protein [Flavobacterium chilense]SHL25844.1 hypothetical protein SAMN05444484_101890 [Flavobacterium chilense]